MNRGEPQGPHAEGAARRRVLNAVLAIACMGAMLAGAAWAVRSAHWPITVVRIDGRLAHTSSERVEEIVSRHTAGAGFFRIRLASLRADLEALPWLRSASLRRIWPDTLDVVVLEHRAAARWNDGALISARGVVFRPRYLPEDSGLPLISGPAGHGPEMLESLRAIEDRLTPLDLSVHGLHQDARRSWRVGLDNGIVVRLGRGEISSRLERFEAVWPAVLARKAGRIEAVDLRYPNGFAVAWRDGEGSAAPREGGA